MDLEKKGNILNICCIGAGYVGGPTMAVIANNCKTVKVTVVDVSRERIDAWNDINLQNLPIFEPQLKEIISSCRGKNLFFSTEVSKAISNADIIFICVNTPTKERGLGAGKASNLKWIELCAKQIANYSVGHTLVVEKSTVPVKTAQVLKTILNCNNSENNSNKSFSILSNPEFLSEGNAIKDLENPDRILIGGEDENSINLLSSIYENWVDKSKIIKTNLWSSELSKLTANAFLAQRISSVNSISALCEKTGADIEQVVEAVGSDKRIGNSFLKPGPGFGGSCFKKDILNLVYLCEFFGLNEVAEYWNGVLKINEWQQDRISKILIEKLFNTLSGKKIAILGFAFKANTNDIRESPAINICNQLINEGAFLRIHDPKVKKEQIEKELKLNNIKENESINDNNLINFQSWNIYKSVFDCINGSDCILILTEWEEYKNIEWNDFIECENNTWIFDARLLLDKKKFENSKFNYWKLGS